MTSRLVLPRSRMLVATVLPAGPASGSVERIVTDTFSGGMFPSGNPEPFTLITELVG